MKILHYMSVNPFIQDAKRELVFNYEIETENALSSHPISLLSLNSPLKKKKTQSLCLTDKKEANNLFMEKPANSRMLNTENSYPIKQKIDTE